MLSLHPFFRFALLAAAAALCAPSCGGAEASCVDYCEEHKRCKDVDEDWRFVACDEICAFLDDIGTQSNCEAAFEAYSTCAANAPDICEDDDLFDVDSCDDQWRAFEKCSDDFCDKHRDTCDPFGSSDTIAGGSTGGAPRPR